MMLQSFYQRRRHYVRTSLGKAKDIDLADTETLVEKPTDLAILVPLLFLTYVRPWMGMEMEMGIGVNLSVSRHIKSRVGVCFCIMPRRHNTFGMYVHTH